MSPSMTLGRERMGLNLLFESFNFQEPMYICACSTVL